MSTPTTGRLLAAACLVLTGVGAVLSAALAPVHGGDHLAAIDAFAAHSGRVDAALTANLAAVLLGASLALAALLASPRAPRLAAAGGWLGIISSAAAAALAVSDVLTQAAADTDRANSAALLKNLDDSPQFGVFVLLALVGGLAALACLGVALWRSRAIPRWAAALLVAYQPLNLATSQSTPALYAAANALLLIALGACALAILRGGLPTLATGQPTSPDQTAAARRATPTAVDLDPAHR
ncbi:MAG: hypothetical protein IRZ32_14090 [Solirubrobacteraceae bacterium]|nr:hypothetical protein [Solirubrobacteraceae bacterium]